MLISRSVSGSCTSASIVGAGLFSTSLKWSATLASSPPCLINRRVRGPVVLSLMALIILVFSVGGLFCLTCQVFHVGPLVCPCHPLYCEPVCFSLVLLVSLFQPLWSCVHDFLLLDFSAFDGLSGNYCDPVLPLHLPASQVGVADLYIGYSIRTVWHESNKDSRLYLSRGMPSSLNRYPRHDDLMEGAVTTEQPRQLWWSESNTSYKVNIDFQASAPRPLGVGICPLHCGCHRSSVARSPSMKSGFRGFESRSGI